MKKGSKNSKRYCPVCGSLLSRKGTYANGKIRLYCPKCKKSVRFGKNAAKALKEYHGSKKIEKSLTCKLTIPEQGMSYSTFRRHKNNFQIVYSKMYPFPKNITSMSLDGTWVNFNCYLIATFRIDSDTDYPLAFKIVNYEKCETGYEFIRLLPKPEYFVCDGQKGLIKAIKLHYPSAKIQICLGHIYRRGITKLTLNPKTPEGEELLQIYRFLLQKVKNKDLAEIGVNGLEDGYIRAEKFLKERTEGEGKRKWQYKHRNVRSAYHTLKKNLDRGMLFVFLDKENVPRTNNGLEGGINSQIKRTLRFHLGANQLTQNKIVLSYLDKRKMKP